MRNEAEYISFALLLLQRFHTHQTTAADDISDYGLYYNSKKIKNIDEHTIYRQLTYKFIQQGLQLPYKDNHTVTRQLSHKLIELMKNNGYLKDLDYNGFNWDEEGSLHFGCEEDINLLMDIAVTDSQFKNDAEEWYRLYLVYEMFNYTPNFVEIERVAEVYKRLKATLGEGKQVPVYCKLEKLLNFGEKTRTERERVKFCYYLGIRSLIGLKKAVSTNRRMIKCRMIGAKNQTDLKKVLQDKRLESVYDKYSSDYYCDLFIKELISEHLIFKYNYGGELWFTSGGNVKQAANSIADAIAIRDSKVKEHKIKELDREIAKLVKEKLAVLRGESIEHPPEQTDND